MSHPTVFISHRHADAKVARIVADFLDRTSCRQRLGAPVVERRLRAPGRRREPRPHAEAKLAGSDVVVLVFTAEGPGWSWCMWECGVATDPHDESSSEGGRPAVRRRRARRRTSTSSASTSSSWSRSPASSSRLLATNDLFPHRPQPLCGYGEADPELRELAADAARRARRRHRGAAGAGGRGALGVDLPVRRARQGRPSPTCETAEPGDAARLIAERGRIVDKQGANALFGRQLHGESLERLQVGHPAGAGPGQWFDALVEQIRTAVARACSRSSRGHRSRSSRARR